MLRIVFALLLLFVDCCSLLIASEHPAQPDTLVITKEMLAKGVYLDSLRVRFHAGDDIRWKERDFDDSAWQVVRNDTAGKSLEYSIGWIRAAVRLAPENVPEELFITGFSAFGAIEVYWDGNLMLANGQISSDTKQEISGLFHEPPVRANVLATDTNAHTLALRISRRHRSFVRTLLSWWYGLEADVHKSADVYIRNGTSALQYAQERQHYAMIQSICAGVLVLMFFFLLYLYKQDKSDDVALFFALYLCSLMMVNGGHVLQSYAHVSSDVLFSIFFLNSVGSFLSIVFLLICAHAYFQVQSTQLYKFIIALCAAAMMIDSVWKNTICYYLAITLSCETLRILILSFKRPTVSVPSLPLTLGVASAAILDIRLYTNHLLGISTQDNTTILLSYLAIPFAITFVLVRRTAQDRARLARYSHDLEEQVRERTRELQTANEEISRQMEVQAEQAREIEKAHKQSEHLLLNILPAPIAHRLKSGERAIADKFDAVTVLFADIVGFTKLSANTTPEELVQGLNAIFQRFDELAHKYGLEKIKTIGDAYMVAGGLPEHSQDHCERVAMFALEMQAVMLEEGLRTSTGERVQLRIGIHTGEAVAGVIGTSKFAYDLWGDTVNTASRMESHGEAGKIHCSNEVYEALKEKFVFEERGEIEVKGKGMMRTWFLLGSKI
jgi:class 3 adenylate cyclase